MVTDAKCRAQTTKSRSKAWTSKKRSEMQFKPVLCSVVVGVRILVAPLQQECVSGTGDASRRTQDGRSVRHDPHGSEESGRFDLEGRGTASNAINAK